MRGAAKTHYEHQEDTDRTVRVWGETAVVTAKLRGNGVEDRDTVNYVGWCSDICVRTAVRWR